MICMTCRMIDLLDYLSTHIPGIVLTIMGALFGDFPVLGWALTFIGIYILMREITRAMNNSFNIDDISDPVQMERFIHEWTRTIVLFALVAASLGALAPVMSAEMFVSLVLVSFFSVLTHSPGHLEDYAAETLLEALLRTIFKRE